MNAELHIERMSVRLGEPGLIHLEPAVWSFSAAKPLLLLRGQNGVGKTTLLNVLSGHLAPVGGAALLDGTVLTGRGPRWSARHGIIRSYQFPLLCDELAVWENIALPLLDHCYSSPERVKPTVEGLLRGVDLLDRAGVSPAELSFGQRRLTELLRVEAQVTRASPRLVLLDEPFAGLDPVHRGRAFDLVKRIAASGAPIILVEHDDDLHGLQSLLWQMEMATSSNGTRYMVQGSAC